MLYSTQVSELRSLTSAPGVLTEKQRDKAHDVFILLRLGAGGQKYKSNVAKGVRLGKDMRVRIDEVFEIALPEGAGSSGAFGGGAGTGPQRNDNDYTMVIEVKTLYSYTVFTHCTHTVVIL
jgi:hypothetical protein